MYQWSTSSHSRIGSCRRELQILFNVVLIHRDCIVITGHRTQEAQNAAYRKGGSKLQFPHSKHNSMPSMAIDVAPYPLNWGESGTSTERRKAIARFYEFAGYVLATADQLGFRVRWGGDWDQDLDYADQSFDDLVHFELVTL